MIEKVSRAGAEVGDVKGPARQRNRESEFVLLIALTPQRQETKSLLGGLLEQRTIHREQRRSLIVASVESAQDPVECGMRMAAPIRGSTAFSLMVEPKWVSRTPPLMVSQLVSLY